MRPGPNLVCYSRPGLHLPAKFYLNVFIVSASCGQKPQFWANFDILGGSCTNSFLPMTAKFGVQMSTVYAYMPNFVSIETPFYAVFWTSALVSRAVEHAFSGTRMHNYKPSPIQRYQNRFCTPTHSWRNQAHTISDVQKRDGQTYRQTNRQKT